MNLNYLAVSDIGPFRGLHQFDFSSSNGKNGFAIFSKNGRGKTTLYNAMQWCLFGNVFERSKIVDGKRIQGKKRVIVGEVDEPLMNFKAWEEDKRCQMSVIIVAEGEQGQIQITRTASAKTTLPRTDEDLEVSLTVVVGNESSSDRVKAQEMIERFFPSELSRFFFIDGEILQEYVNLVKDSQVGGIREDVEDVLRIPALTRGLDDLEEIIREQKALSKTALKVSRAAGRKVSEGKKLESQVMGFEEQISSKRRTLKRSVSRFEEIEDELSDFTEAEQYIRQIRDLRLKEEALSSLISRTAKSRVSGAKNAWKVLVWKKAGRIHSTLEEEMTNLQNSKFQIDTLTKQIEERESELSAWTGICTHCNQPLGESGESHRESLNTQISEKKSQLKKLQGNSQISTQEMSVMLGDLTKLTPPHGTEATIAKNEEEWKEDRRTLINIREKIDKLEEKGLEGIDQKRILELSEEKGKLRSSIRTLEVKIDELVQQSKILSQKARNLIGSRSDSNSDREGNDLLTMEALSRTIMDTIEEFREEARIEVEERASEAFRSVINAPEALTGVMIDKNFRAKIRGADGKQIRGASSGQEVTMTLCVLDALRRTSKINAPIFFDTPGRSLDEDHKKAQLEYFWKVRDNQFIIFPHSGEYRVSEVIEEFGGEISKAWELLWNADYENCPECGNDSLLKERGEKRCLDCGCVLDLTSKSTIVRELVI